MSFTYETRKVETTEWEDILVAKDIIPERAQVKEQREAAEDIAKRGFVTYNKDEASVIEKLESVNNDKEFDAVADKSDDRYVEEFLEKRKKEMIENQKQIKHGRVVHISKADFIAEVAEGSKAPTGTEDHITGKWVVVELYQLGIERSTIVTAEMDKISKVQDRIKFVRIRADDCVENWREIHTPALFLYYGGKMQHQLINPQLEVGNIETQLKNLGVFEKSYSEIEEAKQERKILRTANGATKYIRRQDLSESEDSNSDGDW